MVRVIEPTGWNVYWGYGGSAFMFIRNRPRMNLSEYRRRQRARARRKR